MTIKVITDPNPEEELRFYPKGDHAWAVLTSRPYKAMANPPPSATEQHTLSESGIDTSDLEALRLALEMLRALG